MPALGWLLNLDFAGSGRGNIAANTFTTYDAFGIQEHLDPDEPERNPIRKPALPYDDEEEWI